MRVLRVLRWPVAIVSACGLAAMAVLAVNSHWVRIETVQMDLVESSTEDLLFERIRSTLQPQFQKLEGRYFWEVPLRSVFELVTKDKRVKRVAVYREFPSLLRIEIEPHTPVLAFLSKDGRIYPVATDATLLPALPAKDAPDLPFIRGEEFKDEHALRESALELYSSLPEDGGLSQKNVSEIIYTKKDGFKVFVSGSDAEVKLGDTDFGPKISRVQRVLSYLESQSIKGRVIDARFSKKVVVRVRNTP